MNKSRTSRTSKGQVFGSGLLLKAALLLGAAYLAPVPALANDDVPFLISVDGSPVVGMEDAQRNADVSLSKVDIQVKFDGLGVQPVLNVATAPVRASYRAGEAIQFFATNNYPVYIARAEIRISEAGKSRGDSTIAVIPVSPLGIADWTMPADGPSAMEYVLRVYDEKGRYDQTKVLPLARTGKDFKQHEPKDAAIAPGWGEDRTDFRNIPVWGGAVTVYGRNVPLDHDVTVLGEPVPVDGKGEFVIQRILPVGAHSVDVAVLRDGDGLRFARDIEIPKSEWFYVGQADFTARYRTGDGKLVSANPGDYEKVVTQGRLAFYLKGKIKGKYLLTASGDTGEGRLVDMFRGLDGKSPRDFLKRIDPDSYYPVYGDDSSAVEDAPTRGKFYVRLDHGGSHVMWGNFRSGVNGTYFLHNDRSLYGASAVYRSPATSASGEAVTAVDAYAALPDTLPQRDTFRGTGGSAYFLKHRDITPGSESVWIEVRNRVTGYVIERRSLTEGEDYRLDTVQGVVLLSRPLPSTNGAGNSNYLQVSYEYTPVAGDTDGYVTGARAQQWLGDHVRVGVTGAIEKTGKADQKLYGADVRLQADKGTYIEAEVARSDGPGFDTSYSADGGLTNGNIGTAGVKGHAANAYRVNGQADLDSLSKGKLKGSLGAYYEKDEKWFSSLDLNATQDREMWGAKGDLQLSEHAKVSANYDAQRNEDGTADSEVSAKADLDLGAKWTVSPEVVYSDRQRPGLATQDDVGERGDARLKITHHVSPDTDLYAFGQTTFVRSKTRDRDDRVGVGGKTKISEKVGIDGEISQGTLGLDAEANISYEPTADDRYYLGYRLDAERSGASDWPYSLQGDDLGSIVAGTQRRFNDQLTMFAEDNYDMFGKRRSLTQAYGVTYTPDARWTISGAAEIGSVFDDSVDPNSGSKNYSFDRKAFSSSVVYHDEDGLDAKVKGEVRIDNSDDNSRDRTSWLFGGGLGVKVSEDWRALGSFDAVFSDATDTTLQGDYVEGSAGFAYRPAKSDRLNALFKYTYLYDNPGADQVTVDGTTDGPAQRSHIFSGDVNYDLTRIITLGAKYGFRLGEKRERTPGATWQSANAHLGILRADLHVVHNWDALVEGRALWQTESETVHYGLVAAVYRHLGDHVKMGVGYNFGAFSDDLRDLTLNDHGVFLNLLGEW